MDDEAPGWDAIDAVFAALYPGQEPEHWGTAVPARVLLGGPESLDGISAYDAGDHRHWVTYGLTELYAKESEILERSGWGYELTMRAPADADWPRELLRGLANWADASRTLLHAGEVGTNGGPLFSDRPCELTGWALIEDPALPPIDTPHGRVEFLQVVTLRPEEVERWRELRPELERRSPVELNTLTRPPSGPRAGSDGSAPGR